MYSPLLEKNPTSYSLVPSDVRAYSPLAFVVVHRNENVVDETAQGIALYFNRDADGVLTRQALLLV